MGHSKFEKFSEAVKSRALPQMHQRVWAHNPKKKIKNGQTTNFRWLQHISSSSTRLVFQYFNLFMFCFSLNRIWDVSRTTVENFMSIAYVCDTLQNKMWYNVLRTTHVPCRTVGIYGIILTNENNPENSYERNLFSFTLQVKPVVLNYTK